MRNHTEEKESRWARLLPWIASATVLAVALLTGGAARLRAQSAPKAEPPEWQKEAGGKQAFDSATVKLNKSGPPPSGDRPGSNVPLDSADAHAATNGSLTAANNLLINYLAFAYEISGKQLGALLPRLPKWAITERFDIEARAGGDPTKDQMRLMMQSLLADRFKLAVHYEAQQLPVFGLALAKPGKTGPQLKPHLEGSPCAIPVSPRVSPSDPPQIGIKRGGFPGFPAICGGFYPYTGPGGDMLGGARNVDMGQIATLLNALGTLDRPILDHTGLSGTFDFVVEFSPLVNGPPPPGAQPTRPGATFEEALRDQLGLTLEPQTGPVPVLVIDHIEEPAPN